MQGSEAEADVSSMGEVEEPEITIDVPREPEVRPEVYHDVVALLTRGFLMIPVEIGDVQFVFKSLNHHEMERVRLLSGLSEKSRTVPPRFWDLFLAHMVVFVDGQNLLVDRQRHMGKVVDAFRDMPLHARQRLIRTLSDLNRKVSNATMLVEAYATESASRWRWAQVQGLDLSSPALTGMEGTEKLGLSYAQLTWRAINYYEDLRHQHDVDWENAKFIGGCFAGKEMQKVHDKDRDRRQKERDERWNRKDQILRYVLLGDPLEGDKRYGKAQVIITAKTVEELADQVQRSLRGEKDWHDEVVEAYEANLRKGAQERQGQIAELVEKRREEMGGKDLVGQTSFAGLSSRDVMQRVRSQQEREAALRAQAEETRAEERTSAHNQRWGLLDDMPTTDRPSTEAIPLQRKRNAGKPWRPLDERS
jgi:hypothetical protein